MRCRLLLIAFSLVSFSFDSAGYADERGADAPRTRDEIYGQGVRETGRLSPAEELKGFHLPQGFVAELVAAEPQIAKPLNMAFDAEGRLWITDTTEYPYPAPAGKPAHDTIRVLSDRDRDGTYETVTTFADDLNIPIGILPVDQGVICFSIPNIMLLRDTDGDGRCDERKVLLGPFDTTRDTHGMINALRRGADGWIYACHGFNNQSHVKAADGSEIHLISGNTFRFREDGSHVEQFTNGQVNPFGMTVDEWGQWYTADCHSKPVTLLVEGGSYESFGRPHDGLGFVPAVMDHLHGSTAICGISKYLSSEFPEPFRGTFFSGNVMTSRINANRLGGDRDQVLLVEQPDFMTSDDPWFRPVDIQLGTDGALYVADFYNKIIGHYEVRLDHPERDRTSGRIWRIAYRGDADARNSQRLNPASIAAETAAMKPLSEEHLNELAHSNVTRRRFALERLMQAQWNDKLRDQLRELVRPRSNRPDHVRVAAIWALHQHAADDVATLASAITDDAPLVVAAVFNAWADQPRSASITTGEPRTALVQAAHRQLASDTPQRAIAAASALARHGDANDVRVLLQSTAMRTAERAIVPHTMRIALKRLLLVPEIEDAILPRVGSKLPSVNAREMQVLASVLPAVNSTRSTEALLLLAASKEPGMARYRTAAVEQACKQMRPEFLPPVLELLNEIGSPSVDVSEDLSNANLDEQTALAIDAISTLRTAGHAIPDPLREMVLNRLIRLVQAVQFKLDAQRDRPPLLWSEGSGKLWPLQNRARQGSPSMIPFHSSHALGEQYTGRYRSDEFACPVELSFWLCGHDGPPGKPAQGKSRVELVLVDGNKTIAQAAPPRKDAATKITWTLAEWAGKRVRVEAIDDDAGDAYAWIALADFSLPELNTSLLEAACGKIARMTEALGKSADKDVLDRIVRLIPSKLLNDSQRAKLVSGVTSARGRTLARLLVDRADQRGQWALVSIDLAMEDESAASKASKELASKLAAQMTLSQQTQVARALIASHEGRQLLVELIDEGRMALQSLRPVKDLLGASASNDSDKSAARLFVLSEQANATPSAAEQSMIDRIASFKMLSADVAKGKLLYEKNCANCHKLRGAGQLVGPQLDGVGPRGPERLAEDILLPNRNVDKAFRMTSVLTDDDRVIVGLVRELAGGRIEIIGTDGKSKQLATSEIASRRDTDRSLMPDNFGELLGNEELSHLLEFIIRGQ